MNLQDYFIKLSLYFPILPGALICYIPMKNQLKPHWRKHIALGAVFSGAFALIAPVMTIKFGISIEVLFYSLLSFCFLVYLSSLKAHISKIVNIYLLALALMCFVCNYTNYVEAILYPYSGADEPHMTTGLLQFGMASVLAALTAYPLSKYGRWLIDNLSLSKAWNSASVILTTFIICNLLMVPHKYETLHTNLLFLIYPIIITILLILMLLIYALFYFIAIGIMNASKNAERIRFLEMQEKQYLSQKNHIEETRRLRHDFRHTLNVLHHLSKTKEYDALDQFLDSYIESIPPESFTNYTNNSAINAILNYYAELAQQSGIELDWPISLPEDTGIADYDLCSILGNILENCIHGCQTVPEGKRYHRLAVTTSHNTYLYIVSVNSFDGHVRQIGEAYLSTRSGGSGIGLSSIDAIAEKYGGSAQFHHNQDQFYIDLMLPMRKAAAKTALKAMRR